MHEISCAPFEEVFIENPFSDCYRGLATPNIYIYIHPYKTVGLSPLLFLIVSQIISIQKWLLPSRHPIILLLIHYEVIPYHVPTHEKYEKNASKIPSKWMLTFIHTYSCFYISD